jgi:small ligand-binding sensory domain FIST
VSNVLGCICKDEVGSITEVEGKTSLTIIVASRFKIRKLSVDFPR